MVIENNPSQKKAFFKSGWFIGSLFGLLISIFLISLTWFCFFSAKGESGMVCWYLPIPFVYLLKFTGLDFFTYLISNDTLFNHIYLSQIFGLFLLIILGAFIGFCIDKNYSKKQKLTFLILLLLIFVPLSSSTHFLKNRDNNLFQRNSLPNEGSEVGLQWKTPETMDTCNKISIFNPKYKNECIIAVATTEKNKGLCENLLDTDKETDFWYKNDKERCVVMVANITQNLDLCKNLKNLEVECITNIAIGTNNLELCTPMMFECITNIALLRKDSEICENLYEKNSKASCYQKLSESLNDETLCQKMKDHCLTGATNDELSCNNGYDYCIHVIAENKQDIALCDLIIDESYKEYCRSQVNLLSTTSFIN